MLKLYNTMSGSKEIFKPNQSGKASIFSCGPSIYKRPHIGNYRTFLYEDLLIKYLKHLKYNVRYTTILTDIEDKSISEALEKGEKVDDLTEDVAKRFFSESKLLKIDLPEPVPRSSTGIKQTAFLIKRLLETGHAYEYRGDIYFDPLKFKGFGKLFKLDMKRWPKKKVRFKRDTYNGRRWNRGDFILWHGYRKGDITAWDTEIGKGRPSWNIQDPAIVTEHLGYSIDINCGGIDNIYRHHDYNIAIIESISGKEYANYYLHGEHLTVNGKSMSKSSGNILYPEDMFKNKYKPHHLRFFLLYTHYRKKLNLTDIKYSETCEYLNSIRQIVKEIINIKNPAKKSSPEVSADIDAVIKDFENKMNDDLGFGRAVDGLFTLLKRIKIKKDNNQADIKNINRLENYLREIDSFAGVLF